MKKAISNKVTKENLTILGDLLRNSKELKKMFIRGNEGREVFENKKDFCFRILNLLNNNNLLVIDGLKDKGYFGMTNPNLNNYIDSKIIEEITVSVYVETKKPETLGECLNAEGFSLD